MSVQNVSSVNNVNFKGNKTDNKANNTVQQENKIKNGKKKLLLALAGLGAVAVAGVAIYKGKGVKLSNINFDKGEAFLPNGDKFTGKIKDKLPNGDKIVMEYADGVLKKSTRSGKVNFEKVYETVNNEKIVKKTINGITTEFNITKTQQEVHSAQEKLKSVLDNGALSSKEVKEQTDAIKFKSNNQKKEIETAINKKPLEETAKETEKQAQATEITVEKAKPKEEPKVEKAKEKVVNKATALYSGNAEKRLEALKNNEYMAECIENLTSEEVEAFKKLKPEILEQVDDFTLEFVFGGGDIEKITTTLNDVSPETLKALNDIGIGTRTLVGGLSRAGKKPTAESIIEKLKYRAEELGLEFNYDKAREQANKSLQYETQKFESQFKRVKLLDKVFTPDGIRSMKGNVNLNIWLRGDIADEPISAMRDGQFISNFCSALSEEFKGADFREKILELAQKL